MARKAKRAAARWLKWTPAMAEVFRLGVAAGWNAPASVRLSPGQSRMTLSARFTGDDGRVMTARIRLARDPVTGGWDAVGEELSIPLGTLRSGAAE